MTMPVESDKTLGTYPSPSSIPLRWLPAFEAGLAGDINVDVAMAAFLT
jgi:hypothetical protein